MRRIALPALAVTLAGLTGCSNGGPAAPSPAPITVGGALRVPRSLSGGFSQECVTGGGYSDIKEGAQVVITDEANKTIALGHLEGGTLDGARCVFPFSLPDVPAGHRFYGIEVSHRGRLQYTAEQLAVSLQLTVGD